MSLLDENILTNFFSLFFNIKGIAFFKLVNALDFSTNIDALCNLFAKIVE